MTTSKQVAIIMGSDSDWPVMKQAVEILEQLKVSYTAKVVSAHRMPEEMFQFAKTARSEGYSVIIAGAGGAAHLPGMVAALTEIPVIGVPIPHGPLAGEDSLLSIVQMPKGVPVATVAIGNAWNAGILAAQILGAGGIMRDDVLLDRIAHYKEKMRQEAALKELTF